MLALRPLLVALNHLLGQAGWAMARLKSHAGKSLHVVVPPFHVRLRITEDGLLAEAEADSAADAEISLPAHAPLLVLRGSDQLMKAAHISGAADLVETIGFVLANLRWDAEEDLSRVIGDIAARRTTDTAHRFVDWQRQALTNLTENVAEYLTQEKRMLATGRDIATLTGEIQQIEEALAILDRRVQRLN